MEPRDNVRPQSRMNRPMPLEPAHRDKRRGRNRHLKMALATLAMPGVAAMLFAFIDDLQPTR